MVNKKRLMNNFKKLISLDSQNPPGDETGIADFVAAYLKKLGLKVKIYTFSKNRPNVLAVLKGADHRRLLRSLLLTPHLDTVPAGNSWKHDPLQAKVIGDKVYGLGATDCKCNLAALMEAIHVLVEDRIVLNYDLIFAATADEECGSGLGLIPLLKRNILKPDAAVVLDADDFEIVVTQKGLMHLKVKIFGKKAHGAYPWLGINAIDLAAKIINDLQRQKKVYPSNKYLHPATINVGTIRGGDKVNVVSGWCEFELDFRFLPGACATALLRNLKKTIAKYTKNYKIEVQGIQNPYSIDPKHPLVSAMVSAMKNLQVKPRISGSEGATVITFFKEKNIPAIATGFSVEGCAHIADEYTSNKNLYQGASVLVEFLRKYKA